MRSCYLEHVASGPTGYANRDKLVTLLSFMSVATGLQIAEVLQNILSHCDDSTNYYNALVCKSFSQIALDLLWYEVTDLKQFLQLFGELEETGDGFEYTKMPTSSPWRRFEQVYQMRIRILKIASAHDDFLPALRTLAFTRSAGPLLPKLYTLEWFGLSGLELAEPSVMFMHEGIRNFKFDFEYSAALDAFSSFCDAISDRMPFLSTLELYLMPEQAYQKPMLALTQRLTKLEKFSFPSFEDPSVLLLGLRDNPELCLKDLTLFCSDESTFSSILSVPNAVQTQGFKSLQNLILACSYSFAQPFLRDIAFPADLRIIRIESERPEVSNNILDLISQIASNTPRLTALVLGFSDRSDTVRDELLARPSAYDMIHAKDLSPLLHHCPDIKHFELETPYPLALDDDDMEAIAKHWPYLTVLRLSSAPGVLLSEKEKRLTLKALSHLSYHCSALKEVALYVDATRDYLPDFTSMEVKRLRSLEKLDIGHSPIDHHGRVAYVLAQLCSFQPQVISGSNWSNPDEIAIEINSVWKTEWNAVDKAFEVMLEMQETMDSLEGEVKNFRRKLGQV